MYASRGMSTYVAAMLQIAVEESRGKAEPETFRFLPDVCTAAGSEPKKTDLCSS